MKTKGFLFLHLVFILVAAASQNLEIPLQTYADPNTGIFIHFVSGTQMETWKFANENSSRRINYLSGKYLITDYNGMQFLTVAWNNNTTEKYLILLSVEDNYLFLYKNDAKPYFWGSPIDPADHHALGFVLQHYLVRFGDARWIGASSTLTEGRTAYSTDKLGLAIGECWVEGVQGHGINEKLTLNIPSSGERKIYVSSGFVSFQKPNLFRDNSRIKRIRISGSSGALKIVTLRDTPHFQAIDISGLWESNSDPENHTFTLFMEILEVYPGAKYDDTCLNSVYHRVD